MSRGASVHFKPVLNPAVSEVHNTRSWEPDHPAPRYLLPPEHHATLHPHGRGFARVIGKADPRVRHAEKMWLASGKARNTKRYSPLWEGVLNLPHPTRELLSGGYEDMLINFAKEYERITGTAKNGEDQPGHQVIVADVHTDEGRIEPNGEVRLNVHAHIVVDRTDSQGRVIKPTLLQLKQIQDAAARLTGLERGKPAVKTKRPHISHQAYRWLAEEGLLISREDQERAAVAQAEALRQAHEGGRKEGRQEAERERERALAYGELRGLLIASGIATQTAYQEAKRRYEAGDDAWIEARAIEFEKFLEARRVKEAAKLEKAEKGQEAAEKLADELKKTVEAERQKARQVEPAAPPSAPPAAGEPAPPASDIGMWAIRSSQDPRLPLDVTLTHQGVTRVMAQAATKEDAGAYVQAFKTAHLARGAALPAGAAALSLADTANRAGAAYSADVASIRSSGLIDPGLDAVITQHAVKALVYPLKDGSLLWAQFDGRWTAKTFDQVMESQERVRPASSTTISNRSSSSRDGSEPG